MTYPKRFKLLSNPTTVVEFIGPQSGKIVNELNGKAGILQHNLIPHTDTSVWKPLHIINLNLKKLS